ncbi:MAG: hypothetical protein K1X85_01890 [Ignavibacteria bacterium]|nr:hypothetical protein [Ignavibacteria bacterium]
MKDKIIETIKETAESISDTVDVVKESGADKLKEIMDEVFASAAVINRSGFTTEGVSVNLGLPPEIVGVFRFDRDVPNEEWEKLFAETEDKQSLNALLRALFKAQDITEKLKIGEFMLDKVSVVFTFPPGIGLSFKPKAR